MKDINILIIGGNGYVGSYLSEHLKSKQYKVDVYGNRNQDYNILTNEFLSIYEYVILLAGHSSVACCNGELKSSWNNNVRNFANLVEKTNQNQKIIYASSASVYGNKGGKVFNETDMSLEYINNYDLTKCALDLLALDYINKGKKIIGLRFGTVNGSSPVIRRDLMINSMLYSAIFNNIININNKNISRPILSIKDLSNAVERIIFSEFSSGIYNLASFNSNVDEISKSVQNKTGVKIIDHGDFDGVYDFIIDTTLFKQTFNFTFQDTMQSIIDDVIECYNDNQTKIVTRNTYFHYEN
jgi:nucleoside-diphosphate-sugar epimerase